MSKELEQKIREEAKKLLESGEVKVIVGWGKGSAPFKTTPVFIDKPEDVDKLVWNPACTNNLAVYLPQLVKDGAVGIIAKPCDTRAVVTLLQEKQIDRGDIKVIGTACSGIVDEGALSRAGIDLAEVREITLDGENLIVTTESGAQTIPMSQVEKEACRICEHRTPVFADVTIGETQISTAPADFEDMGTPEERRAFWAKQFERCIRCYACRQVCPQCYCAVCFIDRNDVRWTSKKPTPAETWMVHMGRAMHLAGRCVECGECERACPMDIPLMKLNRQVSENVEKLFEFEAGMDPEAAPVFGRFEPDDPDPNEH